MGGLLSGACLLGDRRNFVRSGRISVEGLLTKWMSNELVDWYHFDSRQSKGKQRCQYVDAFRSFRNGTVLFEY